MMEEALRAYLRGNAGVTALVGTRVEWAVRPQASALPAVVLHSISASRTYTMGGRDALTGTLVQVDCWGATFGSAKAVARAVLAALDALNADPTADLSRAFVENERATVDPGADGSSDFYRSSLDVRVWSPTA